MLKMSQMQLLRLFISERLSVAAEEIFAAVLRTTTEYEQESDQHGLKQEVHSHSEDEPQVFLCAHEQEHWQEWSPESCHSNPRDDQEDCGLPVQEPAAIKQEEQEPWSSPKRQQLPDMGDSEISTLKTMINRKPYTSPVHIKVEGKSHSSSECLTLLPDCSKTLNNMEPESGLETQTGYRISKDINVNHTGRNQRTESLKPHSRTPPNNVTNRGGKSYFSGEEFSHSEHLAKHTQIHTSEKLFICEVCGKTFRHGNSVAAHMRIHSEEKRYRCRICGKDFRHVGNLNVHTRIHTGEKPYSCPVCGKKFSRNYLMTKHMAVHTG
uniref:zinc finger protein 8-like n=1 Tax=Semicossyphus pulcher TaxID=241346 RepID=UPI0037E89DBB